MGSGNIIGFDLNENFCQISYFDDDQQEPRTMEVAADNYQIPLVLTLYNESWRFGREAKHLQTVGKGESVDNLWNRAMAQGKVHIGDQEYEAAWLLAKYVEIVLKPFNKIDYLAFTVSEVDEDVRNMLKRIGAHIGIKKENIFIQDYKESFCHYMFYQPKELWQYEAALFYCDRHEVDAYMLRQLKTAYHKGTEVFVTVDKVANAQMEELASVYPVLNVDKARYADERFKNFIQSVFDKKLISSVFLTGEGFENNWYPNSLRVLCNGRRAFMGNNLYSKGACYAAFRRTLETDDGPIYLDNTKMTEQILIKMRIAGREGWYPLVAWGSQWYEADKQWEVLLEDSSDIEVHIESLSTGQLRIEPVSLEDLPQRDNYSVRLRISTFFVNENTCKVIFTDIGFGEFFPPSGFETEVTVHLGGSNGQFNSLS